MFDRFDIQALKALSSYALYRPSDILVEPILLRSLRDALVHSSTSVRHSAVYCAWALAANSPTHRELREAEIDAALRGFIHPRLPSGGSLLAPTSTSPLLSLTIPPPPDAESREAKKKAREALNIIDQVAR